MKKSSRRRTGQGFVEAVAGIVVIVPVSLYLLDFAAIVLCNQAVDQLAKSAARAAASTTPTTMPDPVQAAKNIVNQERTNSLIKSARVQWLDYDNGLVTLNSPPANAPSPAAGEVSLTVKMKIALPVPFPGFRDEFVAKATEPIVAMRAVAQ